MSKPKWDPKLGGKMLKRVWGNQDGRRTASIPNTKPQDWGPEKKEMQPLPVTTEVMVLLAVFSSILKVFEYLKLGALGFQQYGSWIQISHILQNFNTDYNITHPTELRLYQKNAKFLGSGHIQNYIMSGNHLISNLYAFYYQKKQWLLTILEDITWTEKEKEKFIMLSHWFLEEKIRLVFGHLTLTNNVKLHRPKSHSPCKPIQEHKGQILHSVFLFAISSKLRDRVSEDGTSLHPSSLNCSQYFKSAVSWGFWGVGGWFFFGGGGGH